MFDPIIGAAIGLGSSLIGDALDESAAKKAKRKAIQAMKELIVPQQETERRADRYGDDVYTRAMGELNEGAFAYSGALNPETLRTLAYSKIAPARSQVELGVHEQDLQYNRGIKEKIAQIEGMPTPTVDFMGAVESGVGGYFAGKQLNMTEELMGQQGEYMKQMGNYFSQGTQEVAGSPVGYNPTLNTIGAKGKKKKPNPFGNFPVYPKGFNPVNYGFG